MEQVREVKKSFCILSAAYIVLGIVLLVWPDLSVKTFCYVFGVGMIIFGCAHLVLYFTKDKLQSVMQMDLVSGIVGTATGAYILLKMEYMLEIIPFALGIVALLGAVVKLQHALDLRRLGASRWYLLLAFSAALFVFGGLLIANPFEGIEIIVVLIGVSLIIDGVGNLLGIFWLRYVVRHLKKAARAQDDYSFVEAVDVTEESLPAARADASGTLAVQNGAEDGEGQ